MVMLSEGMHIAIAAPLFRVISSPLLDLLRWTVSCSLLLLRLFIDSVMCNNLKIILELQASLLRY